MHFIENIGKTLGNENKYHLFLPFLLKGHTKKEKKKQIFFPIINHNVLWNHDSDLVSKKEVKLKSQP